MKTAGIASQIICGIISEELGLSDQNVWLRDQNRKIPNDNGLYVIVGMISSEVISTSSYLQNGNPPSEITEVNALERIEIDVLSRSNDALTRNWEIVAALRSIYSAQQQETNNFKITRIPSQFLNISAAEGGSTLNRYALTFSAFVWYRKTKVLSATGGDYYDDFTTRVDDEKSIGTVTPIIEFEINEGGVVP